MAQDFPVLFLEVRKVEKQPARKVDNDFGRLVRAHSAGDPAHGPDVVVSAVDSTLAHGNEQGVGFERQELSKVHGGFSLSLGFAPSLVVFSPTPQPSYIRAL